LFTSKLYQGRYLILLSTSFALNTMHLGSCCKRRFLRPQQQRYCGILSNLVRCVTNGSNPSGSSSSIGDMMLSGLANDVMVRVVSCGEIIDTILVNNNLTAQASKALAEVMLSTILMGGGLKDAETLQVNIVGTTSPDTDGLRNITCIVDENCKVRGRVGNPSYDTGHADPGTVDLFGREGRMHVIRHHPSYRRPRTGIVELLPESLSSNLARYVRESEQRECVIFTDVSTSAAACLHAVAVLMEPLPQAQRAAIDHVQRNVTKIQQKGLASYFKGHSKADIAAALDLICRECFANMPVSTSGKKQGVTQTQGQGQQDTHTPLRWRRQIEHSCTCGVEKVWRALRMLPMGEIRDILEKDEGPVSIKCDFCGSSYAVPLADIRRDILEAAPS